MTFAVTLGHCANCSLKARAASSVGANISWEARMTNWSSSTGGTAPVPRWPRSCAMLKIRRTPTGRLCWPLFIDGGYAFFLSGLIHNFQAHSYAHRMVV